MNPYVVTIARHTLTAVGSVLVTKGVIDQSAVEPITGGLMGLISVIWSIFEKKKVN